jgi:hypothetical protein
MRAEHTILVVEPERRFCWRDAGWNAHVVYAHRCRTLTAQPGGGVTQLQQEILIDGRLARLAALTMGRALNHGMAVESAALKQRAEGS